MGEEVDAVLVKKVKQTQEVLGAFIRRPPLTEKHLMKPPFRFIHDIVMSVVDSTGFLYGLYDGPELDASTITTRETKTAWMQKFVDCLKLATGQEIDIKVSKILAGQEPARTNDLLIMLGSALTKNLSSDKAVQSITGKDLNSAGKPKGAGDAPPKKKKEPPAAAAAPKTKEASPYSQSVQKKPVKAPSRAKNPEDTKKGASKPVEVPAKGRQSKAGMASSPPKAAKPALAKQASSDRLASSKPGKTPEKTALSRGSSLAKLDGNRRMSTEAPIEETFGDTEGIQEMIGPAKSNSGSRRGSMTISSAATVRASSNYGGLGSSSGPTSSVVGEELLDSAPGSDLAHVDDEEQAEFMGELEFLLNKENVVGFEGEGGGDLGPVESTSDKEGGDEGPHGNEDDVEEEEEEEDDEAGDIFLEQDLSHDRFNEFPGSGIKEQPRKNSSDSSIPLQASREEQESLSIDLNETNDSPAPFIPTPSRKSSALPNNNTRVKTASSPGHTPSPFASPHPSTSALSLTTAALGPVSPSTTSLSGKLSAVLPDINEKIQRPPTARPHTSQMRPGGPGTAGSIPRPPSARPAPPRPKTALFAEKEESTFRPTTAKVANVLLDSHEDADDDNYIVHEAAPPEKQAGELQLEDSASNLGLGVQGGSDNIDQVLDPDQRGLLVMQMLAAQSKLEDGSRIAPGKKTDIEKDAALGDKDRLRWREVTASEVEKLKNLMQLMARNANPLGKLMDFVQEDVDAMQRDLNKWREESRKLDSSLEAAQEETENSLEPLRRRMAELDESIQERQDSIAATKMTIFRQEERIKKVLSGLDRVKPRMANDPIITSADLKNLVELDGNYDFGSGGKVYFKKTVPPSAS